MHYKKGILCLCLAIFSVISEGKTHTKVIVENGALHPTLITRNKIKDIEDKCDVVIEHDDYYTSQDLLTLWANHHYDIAIISSTYLPKIIQYIYIIQSNDKLKKNIEQYNPSIKKQFQKYNLPENILFYSHDIMGALVKDNLNEKLSDTTLIDFFRQNPSLAFTIADEPLLNYKLLMPNTNKNAQTEDVVKFITNLKNSVISKNMQITSHFNYRIQKQAFKLALTTSSSAYSSIKNLSKQNTKAYFQILKESFITTHFIAQLNRKASTDCVMFNLSSKEFLVPFNNEKMAMSPYITSNSVNDPDDISIQKTYYNYLTSNPEWETLYNNLSLSRIFYEWDKYKIVQYKK